MGDELDAETFDFGSDIYRRYGFLFGGEIAGSFFERFGAVRSVCFVDFDGAVF